MKNQRNIIIQNHLNETRSKKKSIRKHKNRIQVHCKCSLHSCYSYVEATLTSHTPDKLSLYLCEFYANDENKVRLCNTCTQHSLRYEYTVNVSVSSAAIAYSSFYGVEIYSDTIRRQRFYHIHAKNNNNNKRMNKARTSRNICQAKKLVP